MSYNLPEDVANLSINLQPQSSDSESDSSYEEGKI